MASLVFSAGPAAYREIRQHGFDPAMVGTIAGASGGAKWLVLSQLDRVVANTLLPRMQAPVHTIGTSIGAWRLACYAQSDPLAAFDRFESAYLDQRYSAKPGRSEISAMSRRILDEVMGERGVAEMLSNPLVRTHVLTVRSRGLLASESTLLLSAGLLAAAALNAVNRRTLRFWFERVLFHDPRDRPPFFDLPGFPMQQVELTADNYKDAVLATGSIPLVLEGVPNINGAPAGVYRDGGVIDYHLDFSPSLPDRLTLYLHFYSYLKPGWFDKHLSWRFVSKKNVDRTMLISPSREFVAGLPNAKIPDRHDFSTMSHDERVVAWRTVVDRCRELGDELHDVLESGRLADRLQPIQFS